MHIKARLSATRLTEKEERALAIIHEKQTMTPRALARALWPKRRDPRLVLRSSRILTRLETHGVLERAQEARNPKTYRLRERGARAQADSGTKTLGTVIRDTREAKGIPLRELAKATGITTGYLGAIETKARLPSEEVLRALAKRLKVRLDLLLFLAGRLGAAADQMLRENAIAARIVRRLVSVNTGDYGLVLELVDGLAEARSSRRARQSRPCGIPVQGRAARTGGSRPPTPRNDRSRSDHALVRELEMNAQAGFLRMSELIFLRSLVATLAEARPLMNLQRDLAFTVLARARRESRAPNHPRES